MGKCQSCLRMLEILRSVKMISVEDLANILEINKRNINEYKKELESIGYQFISKSGVGGGIGLVKGPLLPQLNLTLLEKRALQEASEYLNKHQDSLFSKNFNSSVGKIIGQSNQIDSNFDFINIDKFPLTMDKEQLFDRYTQFIYAIDNGLKVVIIYNSTKNKQTTHVIHPYDLFVYNQAWFILGWNETVNDIGYFKLNRIDKIVIKSTKFIKSYTYKRSDYIDDLGMRKMGDAYDVEIEFYNQSISYITERNIGKNQTLTYKDQNTLLLKCRMHSKQNIISFVLSFGNNAKLLAPIDLVNEINTEIKSLLKIYAG